MNTLYVGVIIVVGLIFAILLVFIVYKKWFSLKKSIDVLKEDFIHSNTCTCPNLTSPIGYRTVLGQSPTENHEDDSSDPLQRIVDLYNISKAKLTYHTSFISPHSSPDAVSKGSPESPYNSRFKKIKPKPTAAMQSPFMMQKNKRLVKLRRGNSLTEDMFIDSIRSNNLTNDKVRERTSTCISQPEEACERTGEVKVIINYIKSSSKLKVHVIKVIDLELNHKMTEINLFVRLYINNPGRNQKQDTKYVTESIKELVFNEIIIFQKVQEKDLNRFMSLTLKVCNRQAPWKRKDVLGEGELPLSLVDLNNEKEFTVTMFQPKSKLVNASIGISVSHDFNVSKLSICVHEAHLPKVGRKIINPSTYVTLKLYHGETFIGKKETSIKRMTTEPCFNETFQFHLKLNAAEDLKMYSLNALLMRNNLVGKDKNIGHVFLSLNSSLGSAKEQWQSAIDSPNSCYKSYHSLLCVDLL